MADRLQRGPADGTVVLNGVDVTGFMPIPVRPVVSLADDPEGHAAWKRDALAAEVATVLRYGGEVVCIGGRVGDHSTTALFNRARGS